MLEAENKKAREPVINSRALAANKIYHLTRFGNSSPEV